MAVSTRYINWKCVISQLFKHILRYEIRFENADPARLPNFVPKISGLILNLSNALPHFRFNNNAPNHCSVQLNLPPLLLPRNKIKPAECKHGKNDTKLADPQKRVPTEVIQRVEEQGFVKWYI